MKFNLKIDSLFGKLLSLNLIIILISLTVIILLFSYLMRNYYYGLKEIEATNNSRRIANLVSENIKGGDIQNNLVKTEEKINTIARSSNMNIGLMNNTGGIIMNTPPVGDIKPSLDNQDIHQILNGNTITKKMMGPDQENLLMGIPLIQNPDNEVRAMYSRLDTEQRKDIELIGALLIKTPLGSTGTTINNILKLILFSFLVAIIAAIALSIPFTKKITKPLENIQQSALQSINGDFQKVDIPEKSSKEIKHLINTFNYAVTQINENLKKKKRLENLRKKFVADVSHEFRAPLTSIKGFLELIKEQNLSRKKIKEYTGIMYEDTEYLEHLLSDLNELGQLESKNISLKKEPVHPEKLISRAIKSLTNKIQEKNITIDKNLESNLCKIKVDKNRIHQVLINLLDNALNHAPENSKITVSVKNLPPKEQKNENHKVKFSVTDQGKGIPEQAQSKLWQRFYKVDHARTRENKNGSGLGLAIVKNIIEKHNGEINVESNPEKGTTFSFML